MKQIFFLLFIVLVSGCATQKNLELPSPIQSVQLHVDDERSGTIYIAGIEQYINQPVIELKRVNTKTPTKFEKQAFKQLLTNYFHEDWLNLTAATFNEELELNGKAYTQTKHSPTQLVYKHELNNYQQNEMVLDFTLSEIPRQYIRKMRIYRLTPRSNKRELEQTWHFYSIQELDDNKIAQQKSPIVQ